VRPQGGGCSSGVATIASSHNAPLINAAWLWRSSTDLDLLGGVRDSPARSPTPRTARNRRVGTGSSHTRCFAQASAIGCVQRRSQGNGTPAAVASSKHRPQKPSSTGQRGSHCSAVMRAIESTDRCNAAANCSRRRCLGWRGHLGFRRIADQILLVTLSFLMDQQMGLNQGCEERRLADARPRTARCQKPPPATMRLACHQNTRGGFSSAIRRKPR
jgi:hypothetical protein